MSDAIVSQGSRIEVETAPVTISIASPGVVTLNDHGLAAGRPIVFATTGALPTGLVAGTIYYVLAPLTNTFNVAATPGGAAINTSGSQSGVHTIFLTVPGVQETPSLNIANTLAEITDLSSVFREHKGTISGGTLAFNANWLPNDSAHELLVAAAVSKAKTNFRIHFKDEADPEMRYLFSAIVESANRSATVAGVQQLNVSLTLQVMPTTF